MSNTAPSCDSRWKWIRHGEMRLHDVGVLADGTLHNPNGYPDEIVRAAVKNAQERRHLKMSAAAKKAAETRRKRQERKIHEMADRLLDGAELEMREHCAICNKALDDPESIARGIGSDCWQATLRAMDEICKRLRNPTERTG